MIKTENKMLNKKQIKKDYKLQKQPTGIFAVHNISDNKMFIGTSTNLPSVLTRFDFTLKMGSFPFQDLINDYKILGEKYFKIKVLDELEVNDETEYELNRELNALEEMWIDKLKKEGVTFYNKK
ncbi:MAG TPA: GIY-YIG nuclease family protein [Ignavibacteriaceae bacterium]